MSYTNDLKEQHQYQYCEWVAENKFKELEEWCQGVRHFDKHTYEDCLQAYLDSPECDFWDEYFATLPEGDKDKWDDYNADIKSGLTNTL